MISLKSACFAGGSLRTKTPLALRLIALSIIAITFFFGLKPFNFLSKNDAHIDFDQAALVFNESIIRGDSSAQGIARTENELDFGDSPELSILLELESHGIPSGLGVILTFLDEHDQPPLIIAQWQEHIAIRSRRINRHPDKQYVETGIRNCFKENDFFTLLLSSSTKGTDVFINGHFVDTHSWFQLKDPEGPFGGRLVLGNNAYATQPWQGSLKRIALYNKALKPQELAISKSSRIVEYMNFAEVDSSPAARSSFGPQLHIPRYFDPAKRDILSSYQSEYLSETMLRTDIAINIIGFMPIGFAALFLAARSPSRSRLKSCVYALATVFLSSLLIEFLQSFLPSRDSSQLDLLCNTAGGTFAVLIAAPFLQHLRKP